MALAQRSLREGHSERHRATSLAGPRACALQPQRHHECAGPRSRGLVGSSVLRSRCGDRSWSRCAQRSRRDGGDVCADVRRAAARAARPHAAAQDQRSSPRRARGASSYARAGAPRARGRVAPRLRRRVRRALRDGPRDAPQLGVAFALDVDRSGAALRHRDLGRELRGLGPGFRRHAATDARSAGPTDRDGARALGLWRCPRGAPAPAPCVLDAERMLSRGSSAWTSSSFNGVIFEKPAPPPSSEAARAAITADSSGEGVAEE